MPSIYVHYLDNPGLLSPQVRMDNKEFEVSLSPFQKMRKFKIQWNYAAGPKHTWVKLQCRVRQPDSRAQHITKPYCLSPVYCGQHAANQKTFLWLSKIIPTSTILLKSANWELSSLFHTMWHNKKYPLSSPLYL